MGSAPTLKSITDKKIGPDPRWYREAYGDDALSMAVALIMFGSANDQGDFVGSIEKAVRYLWPHCEPLHGSDRGRITAALKLNGFEPVQRAAYRGWAVPVTWQGWRELEPRRHPASDDPNPNGYEPGPVTVRKVPPTKNTAPRLRRRRKEQGEPIPRRQAVLDYLATVEGASTAVIVDATGQTHGQVTGALEHLHKRGLVGLGRWTHWQGGAAWFAAWDGAPPPPQGLRPERSAPPKPQPVEPRPSGHATSRPTPKPGRAVGTADTVRVVVGARIIVARHIHGDLYEEVG
jgi:hypothetical protein